MKYEDTSKRITKALSDKNIKAQELADKTGINKASISQYVNGTNRPSNINAYKMAQVLNVSPEYLMGFDVEPIRKEEALTPLMAQYIAELTKNEKAKTMLDKYNKLNESDKIVVLNLMDSLLERYSTIPTLEN